MKNGVTVLASSEQVPEPFRPVFTHWLAIKGDDWAPPLGVFRLHDLPPALLPWSIITDVGPDGRDFYYRFWGTERVNLIGAEMTGKWLSDTSNAHMRASNMAEYREVIALRQPLLCDTSVVTSAGRDAVFQSIRLPLSDGGDGLAHVYSAVNYMRISNVHYEFYGTEPKLTRGI